MCIVSLALLPFVVSAKQWPAIGLTGGGNALDGIDTSSGVNNGDIALVYISDPSSAGGWTLTYHFDSDASTAETSPVVIAPDTGSGRWLLSETCYKSATFVIEDPTNAENFGSVRLEHTGSIIKVVGIVQGTSPSVAISPHYGSDRSTDATKVFTTYKTVNSTTSGNEWTLLAGDFDNYSFSANNFLWLRSNATGGTVDEISITVFYVYHS